jgi:hypothetical protein
MEESENQSNNLGLAGFIVSLVALLFKPLWVVSLIISFIGLFKKPRGFAIAGFLISLFGILVMGAAIYWLVELIEILGLEEIIEPNY